VYRLLVGEKTKNYSRLLYTQDDGGCALCKVYFLMGVKLRHGMLKCAAYVDRSCRNFRKSTEKNCLPFQFNTP